MKTSVKITPTKKELAARLNKRRGEFNDMTGLWRDVATFLTRWVGKNFRTEGELVGGWKEFKDGGRWVSKGRGKNRRRYLDTSAKLLQDTGRLRLSHLPFSTRRSAGIGTDLPYSAAHNDGLGHLPTRRTVPEKNDVIDDVVRIAEHHTRKALR